MSAIVDRNEVLDLASEVRVFLEGAWIDWRTGRYIPQPETNSYSMCRMSSAFLAIRVAERFPGTWRVLGGAGDEGWDLGDCLMGASPGGMMTADGSWSGHWWVTGHGLIVDVTADQFGHDPVIVADNDDPRYSRNYTQRAMTKYLSYVTKTLADWEDRWSSSSPAPKF